MPRQSLVHYIAPSSISVIPNANNSPHDIAVYVAPGTKIKVYSSEAGISTGASGFQEWTLGGRNRRLKGLPEEGVPQDAPHTIYARLSKNDKSDGYLVFVPKLMLGWLDGQQVWVDRYSCVTLDGWSVLYKDHGAEVRNIDEDYIYVRLGDVTAPVDNKRSLTIDTGILGTEKFNMDWLLNPDGLPLRVELSCTIDGKDAGPTPYVPLDKAAELAAKLVEGWNGKADDLVAYWTISRNTGDDESDTAWNLVEKKSEDGDENEGDGNEGDGNEGSGNEGSGNEEGGDEGGDADDEGEKTLVPRTLENGRITLRHDRAGTDDFAGAVATTFTVTAWSEDEDYGLPEITELFDTMEESLQPHEEEEEDEEQQFVAIGAGSITIFAETFDVYSLDVGTHVVTFSPKTGTCSPSSDIPVRIRSTAQDGKVSYMGVAKFRFSKLRLAYAPAGSTDPSLMTDLELPEEAKDSDEVVIMLPISIFSAKRQSVDVRLLNAAGITLAADSVALVSDGSDGAPGKEVVSIYKWTSSPSTPPATPQTSDDPPMPATDYPPAPGTGWSATAPNRESDGMYLWMATGILDTTTGKVDTWSTPVRISGENGTAGEDGSDMEYIYMQTSTEITFSDTAEPKKPAQITTGKVGGQQKDYQANIDDWVPDGWSDSPQGVSALNKYEYMSWRRKPAGRDSVWGPFSDPILWSHFGRNGMDGDGVEYVFIRTRTGYPAPKIADSNGKDSQNRAVTSDEYLPSAYVELEGEGKIEVNGRSKSKHPERYDNYICGECTDEPQGVSEQWPYEWVAKRTKGAANEEGERQWEAYDGAMALWAKWSGDGRNAVRLDLDNQADIVACDATGKVRFARTVSVNARIYDGGFVSDGIIVEGFTSLEALSGKYMAGGNRPSISGVDNNGKLTSGVLTITWNFNTGNTFQPGTYIFNIALIYQGTTYNARFTLASVNTSAIYQLLPSRNSISFAVTPNTNELVPAVQTVYCGYKVIDVTGEINYPGNIVANLWKEGGAPYNIFFRYHTVNAQAPMTAWGWNRSFTDGTLSVPANTTYTAVEFALSSAHSGSLVSDENILDREVIPIIKSGANGGDGVGFASTTDYYAVSRDKDARPMRGTADDGQARTFVSESAFASWIADSVWGTVAISTSESSPWLWNFEKHTMSDGTVRVTPVHRVGSFAKGIKAIYEYYALSTSGTGTNGAQYPAPLVQQVEFSQPPEAGGSIYNPAAIEIDEDPAWETAEEDDYAAHHLAMGIWSTPRWWHGNSLTVQEAEGGDDYAYRRAGLPMDTPKTYANGANISRTPTEEYPYQWNWERVLYTDGTVEDFWHLSAVLGPEGPEGPMGNTPISLYKWLKDSAEVNAPSSVTAADYDAGVNLGGWSKAAPNRPAQGLWHLYMSQNEMTAQITLTGAWSAPVRISGDKGTPGEDAGDTEWVYQRNSTGVKPATPLSSGAGTVNGKAEQYDSSTDDWVPSGWSDNPQGVDASNRYEYASYREKQRGSSTWGPFSTPVVWSHYGKNGMDGDGVEYVYIRTKTNVAPYIDDDEDPVGEDSNGHDAMDDEYLPMVRVGAGGEVEQTEAFLASGRGVVYDGNGDVGECTDDPQGVSEVWPYEWVAKRTKGAANEEGERQWEKYDGFLSLWAKWSSDGMSQPSYVQAQEAWSQYAESANSATAPQDLTDGTKWLDGTPPAETGKNFLWRRTRTMVISSDNSRYEPSTAWTYIRLNGTNGTSITPRGAVKVIVAPDGILPTTGMADGDIGLKANDPTPWRYTTAGGWSDEGQTACSDGDSYVVTADCLYDADGSGDAENVFGHMFMWSHEAQRWIDLGQFKGDAGVTYFTHIAWAATAAVGGTGVPQKQDWQMNTPNASSVEGFSISPAAGKPYMGYIITTKSGTDPTDALYYTWSYVYGSDGTSPWVADTNNEMDAVICDADGWPDVSGGQQTVSTTVQLFHGSVLKKFNVVVLDGKTENQYTSGTPVAGVTVLLPRIPAGGTTEAAISFSFGSTAQFSAADGWKKVFRLRLRAIEDQTVQRELYFTVAAARPGENGEPATIYQLLPSVSQISVARTSSGDFTVTHVPVTCGYLIKTGSGDPEVINDERGDETLVDAQQAIYFRRRIRAGQIINGETIVVPTPEDTYHRYFIDTQGITSDGLDITKYDSIEFIICNTGAADIETPVGVLDRETVPVVADGKDGAGSVRLDLDNENEVLLYDANGNNGRNLSGAVTSQARLYDGGNDVTGMVDGWEIVSSVGVDTGNPLAANYAVINSSGLLTVNGISTLSGFVNIRATYNGIYYYAKFSVKKQIGGSVFRLVFSGANAITYNTTTETASAAQITVRVMKLDAGGNYLQAAPPTGYGILFAVADGNYNYVVPNGCAFYEASSATLALTALGDVSALKEVRVVIGRLLDNSDEVDESAVLDSETIPISHVADGGEGPRVDVSCLPASLTVPCTSEGLVIGTVTETLTFSMKVNEQQATVTSGTVEGVPEHVSINARGTGMVQVTIPAGIREEELLKGITFNIKGTCDGKTYSKNYAFPLIPSKQGTGGQDGQDGKDAATVVITPSVALFDADPSGRVNAGSMKELTVEMYVDGTQCQLDRIKIVKITPSNMAVEVTDRNNAPINEITNINATAATIRLRVNNTSSNVEGSIMLKAVGTAGVETYTGTASLPVGVVKKGDGGQSIKGHTGRFYYYAGEYDGTPAHYKMEETQAPYVKDGDGNFWMLDNHGTEPQLDSNGEWRPTAGPLDNGQTAWTKMSSEQQYYIARAFFGKNAYLGSFVINNDWMISQYGTYKPDANTTIIVDATNAANYPSAYTNFKPADPMATGSAGYPCFAPNYAVDGLTGKTYQNDAYIRGEVIATSGSFKGSITVEDTNNNRITLTSNGLEGRWGNDGIRLNSDGLQRYDTNTGKWVPFFSKRRVRFLTKDSEQLNNTDDLLIYSYKGGSVTLPGNPNNGDTITIRVLKDKSAYLYLGNTYHRLYTDEEFIYDDINYKNAYSIQENLRYEFVFWDDVWYVNLYGL